MKMNCRQPWQAHAARLSCLSFFPFLSDSPWKSLCTVYIALSLAQATFTCQRAHKDSTGKRERERVRANPLQRLEAELSTQRTQAAGNPASCLMCNTQFGANKLAQTTEILFCCKPAPHAQCAF